MFFPYTSPVVPASLVENAIVPHWYLCWNLDDGWFLDPLFCSSFPVLTTVFLLFAFCFVTYFWLCWSSLLLEPFSSCGEWGWSLFKRAGFSLRWLLPSGSTGLGMWASVVAAPRLHSTGSIVVGHRLSYSMACGIFPDKGSNLYLLYWQADSLPLR